MTISIPMGSRIIPTRTPVVNRVLPSGATVSRVLGGSGTTIPLGSRVIPTRTPMSGIGGSLAQGISVPPALAPAGAFGGRNGGIGAAAAPTALGPATLSGVSSSITSAGTGIINTLGSLIPLAIKIILAVIVIKIVLWLIKGRK